LTLDVLESKAIARCMQPLPSGNNDNPKSFTWTADPDKIIAAVRRGHQTLASSHTA